MNRFAILLVLVQSIAYAATPADPRAASRDIDALLAQDWQKNDLQANPSASDETFVRRLYLDLAGRIPTYRETTDFLEDKTSGKRAQLIDRLLASEDSTLHLFNYWADILRVLSKGTYPGDAGRVTGTAYAEYIKKSVRDNKPYDQMVRELVSAQGRAWDNGAVGYYQRDRGMPLDNMATTIRIFLGTRIECAQCHNHPFDKWTQMQFHQMAAYTYGVQTIMGIYSPSFSGLLGLQMERRKRTNGSPEDEVHFRQALNEMIVPVKHAWVSYQPQALRLPHDYNYKDAAPNTPVKAATLMGAAAPYSKDAHTLESFAAWLTSPDNPRFATLIANRLWKKLFGAGIIEPVDDMSDANPPVNPALMENLRRLMIAQRFDVKAFLRVLCNTEAYQRDATRAELVAGEASHFTGPLLRRMSAEQIWDSFVTLINTRPDLPNQPLREGVDTFLANARKLGNAIENLSPAELFQRADSTSEVFRTNAGKFKELQQQIAEARAHEDKPQVALLARQLGVLRQTEMKTANEQIYVPAVLRLSSKTPQVTGQSYKDIELPGYQPADRSAEKAAQATLFQAEAVRLHLPASQQAAYVKHRQNMMRNWPRAAEIDSPAPAGHPLRELGQSDREAVENGSIDASVPQALLLMNSTMLQQVLHPWSQLMLSIRSGHQPDQQVEAAYVALFSRPPAPRELAAWRAARSQGLTSMEDLVYALLNTQQFIFIQ